MTEQDLKIQLKSSRWIDGEAEKLLEQCRKAKTNKKRSELSAKVIAMKGKLLSDVRSIIKLIRDIGDIGGSESWKE